MQSAKAKTLSNDWLCPVCERRPFSCYLRSFGEEQAAEHVEKCINRRTIAAIVEKDKAELNKEFSTY